MTSRDIVSLTLMCALAISTFAQSAPSARAAIQSIDPNLKSLADTERAFATLGAAKGVRESFLAYFASDGIWFTPEPKVTVDDLKARPAPTGPLPRKLEWTPIYGDVAKAGDLGYDTGPSLVTDLTAEKRPPRYGYFFSIWKKQPDGHWRVVLDLGTQNPDVWDPAKPPEFTSAAPSGWKSKGPSDSQKEIAGLLAAEANASSATQASGAAIAAAQFLDRDARFHRNEISPIIGRDNILAFFAKRDSKAHWEPIKGFVARSADLGYTYGRYWAPGMAQDGTEETGYYAHVWRKDATGAWKLVFHVTAPAPFEKK